MLNEEKMCELKDIFNLIDVDSDGLITKEDLTKNTIAGCQITEEVALQMIREGAQDEYSGMSLPLFLSMFSGKLKKGEDVSTALKAIGELSGSQAFIEKPFFVDLMKKGQRGLTGDEINLFLSELEEKDMKQICIQSLSTLLSSD